MNTKGGIALAAVIAVLVGAIALEAVPIYGALPVVVQAIPLIIIGLSAQNIIVARSGSFPALRKTSIAISVLLGLFLLSFAFDILVMVMGPGREYNLLIASSAICVALGAVSLIVNSFYILRVKSQNS